jgi:carbon monoxide dehydrogenase subunit G
MNGVELQIERRERVMAPLALVWDELNSLDQILAKTLHVTRYELLSRDRARGSTTLTWGPVKKTLDLDVALLGIVAERQIRYAIEARRVESRFEASIDLILLGLNETKLDYHATLEVRHRLAVRMRHPLGEMTEESVDRIIGCVKARSEKRRLAEERLSFERP